MSQKQKLVLIIAILASLVAFLDGFAVNVALPSIVHSLGGGLFLQQWVVDAYLITLGALMLVAGSLSDLLGRYRIIRLGLLGFGITSLLCAFAPGGNFLIFSRALQGAAGALLVPSSLALIMSCFKGEAEAKAIGIWTAWASIGSVAGPLLGGLIIQVASWRWIFGINVIPIAVTLYLLSLLTEEDKNKGGANIDITGAILSALGLGGTVYALIEHGRYGWSSPFIWATLVLGIVAMVLFIWNERVSKFPMMPLDLFRIRNFSAGNVATFFIYAALSIGTFMISIFVQQVSGYSALKAGLCLMPVSIIMFVLSSRFGSLAGKFGPRFFMTVGPVIGGTGFLLMLRTESDLNYWTQLLPGVVIFGLGLSITVSPLTSAILGVIESGRSGIASAVNNAVARIAGLIGVASIGLFMGSAVTLAGFHRGIVVIASLLILGGLVSFAGIQNPSK